MIPMKNGAAALEGCQQGTAPEMAELSGSAATEWRGCGEQAKREDQW